jgi:hypothetical protein
MRFFQVSQAQQAVGEIISQKSVLHVLPSRSCADFRLLQCDAADFT